MLVVLMCLHDPPSMNLDGHSLHTASAAFLFNRRSKMRGSPFQTAVELPWLLPVRRLDPGLGAPTTSYPINRLFF